MSASYATSATSASRSLDLCRHRAEDAVGKKLPFDDDVLNYLTKVGPVSEHSELVELIRDFCPTWVGGDHAALAAVLAALPPEFGEEESPYARGSNGPRAAVHDDLLYQPPDFETGPGPGGGSGRGSPHSGAPQQDLAADLLLAQKLQESEGFEEAFSSQAPSRNGRRAKKGFKPLQINYTVGHSSAAPLGMSNATSMADILRNRRSQGQHPPSSPDDFGPPAVLRPQATWAPAPQDGGMTWAERAQIASAAAAAGMEGEDDQADAEYAAAPARPMVAHIKVRLQSGTEFSVDVHRGDTVGDLKRRIKTLQAVPVEQQRLLHLGRELAPDTLEVLAAGVREEQLLHLAVRDAAARALLPAQPPPPRGPPPPLAHSGGAARAGEQMTVVLGLPGGGQFPTDKVSSATTVAELKQLVQKTHGIRQDRLLLSFFGMQLEDHHTLDDSGIASGGVIDVTVIGPGGATSGPQAMAPSSSIPEASTRPRKAGGGGSRRDEGRFAGLQTTGHGRVLNEEEALELALAASREDQADSSGTTLGNGAVGAASALSSKASQRVDDDGSTDTAVGDAEAEFLVDVSLQEDTIAHLITQAKRVAAAHYDQDLISSVSKRSGYRLTLLVERRKKPKRLFAYTVYRFSKSSSGTINVLQLAVASEHRGHGYGKQMAQWVQQQAGRSQAHLLVLVSQPGSVSFYEQLGFLRSGLQQPPGEGCLNGEVCLEYHCRKAAAKAGPAKSSGAASSGAAVPSRPDESGSQLTARQELIHSVFEALDTDGDNLLSARELRVFAGSIGFAGSDEDWAVEYGILCSQKGVAIGAVNRTCFEQLVEDPSEEGCYCSDEELRALLKNFSSMPRPKKDAAAPVKPPSPPLPQPPPHPTASPSQEILEPGAPARALSADQLLAAVKPPPGLDIPYHLMEGAASLPMPASRDELIQAAFRACDTDGNGLLDGQEMLAFARHTGFQGSAEEWSQEYLLLRQHLGSVAAGGINLAQFERLVNDQSDEGCYCTDDELRAMLTATRKPVAQEPSSTARASAEQPARPSPAGEAWSNSPPAASRPLSATAPPPAPVPSSQQPAEASSVGRIQLVDAAFRACDTNGDGALDEQEMLCFARFTGFDGSPADWSEEYRLLRSHYQGTSLGSPSTGIGLLQFRHLVDDSSEDGCYCTDDELKSILDELRKQVPAAEAPATQPVGPPVQKVPAEADPWYDHPAAAKPSQPLQVEDQSMDKRTSLIKKVFSAIDVDGDDHLNLVEMHRFARLTGFEGPDEDWQQEYEMMCKQYEVRNAHFNLSKFRQLVNDDSEAGCFCTEEELSGILARVLQSIKPGEPQPRQSPAHAAVPVAPAPTVPEPPVVPTPPPAAHVPVAKAPPPTLAPSGGRAELLRAVFRACDTDGNGRLSRDEMRTFAGFVGFTGDDSDWASEFEMLCREKGGNPYHGISMPLFEELVNDETDAGCYCPDQELQNILKTLFPVVQNRVQQAHVQQVTPAAPPPPTAPSSRREKVAAVFRALNLDGDGRLKMHEMQPFARCIGFQGTDADWQEEYALLFKTSHTAARGSDILAGVPFELFQALVEDKSEEGCYCTDEELDKMVGRFSPAHAGPRAQWREAEDGRGLDTRRPAGGYPPAAAAGNSRTAAPAGPRQEDSWWEDDTRWSGAKGGDWWSSQAWQGGSDQWGGGGSAWQDGWHMRG